MVLLAFMDAVQCPVYMEGCQGHHLMVKGDIIVNDFGDAAVISHTAYVTLLAHKGRKNLGYSR